MLSEESILAVALLLMLSVLFLLNLLRIFVGKTPQDWVYLLMLQPAHLLLCSICLGISVLHVLCTAFAHSRMLGMAMSQYLSGKTSRPAPSSPLAKSLHAPVFLFLLSLCCILCSLLFSFRSCQHRLVTPFPPLFVSISCSHSLADAHLPPLAV